MIRSLLKGATTLAVLPVYFLGSAFMVPLLKRQVQRERAKAQSLTAERDEARRHRDGYCDQLGAHIEAWQEIDEENKSLRVRCKSQARCVEIVAAERDRLTIERDAALREADRLRHGQAIEGDYVCPDALRADEAERKLNLANGTVYQQIEALRARDIVESELTEQAFEFAHKAMEAEQQRDRARQWSSLWHETARAYRRLWVDYPGELAALAAAHDGAAAEYQTLAGRLEALRSATRQLIDVVYRLPAFAAPSGTQREALLRNANAVRDELSDGTPPVQDTPPVIRGSNVNITGPATLDWRTMERAPSGPGGTVLLKTEDIARESTQAKAEVTATARRMEVGDYPQDERTQQLASVIEHITRERDRAVEDREALKVALNAVARDRDNLEKVAVTRFDEREEARRTVAVLKREVDILAKRNADGCLACQAERDRSLEQIKRLESERDTLDRQVEEYRQKFNDLDRTLREMRGGMGT